MILTSNKKEKESHINTEFSSLFGLLDMAEQQVDVLLCREGKETNIVERMFFSEEAFDLIWEFSKQIFIKACGGVIFFLCSS